MEYIAHCILSRSKMSGTSYYSTTVLPKRQTFFSFELHALRRTYRITITAYNQLHKAVSRGWIIAIVPCVICTLKEKSLCQLTQLSFVRFINVAKICYEKLQNLLHVGATMLLPLLGRENICAHDIVREIILPLVVLLNCTVINIIISLWR